MALPTTEELARLASQFDRPIVLTAVDSSLTVVAMAGQLAPIFQHNLGKHLLEVTGGDKSARHAALAEWIRALNGEVVELEVDWETEVWWARIDPWREGDAIVGAVAQSTLARYGRPMVDEEPGAFLAVQEGPECRPGDLFTVRGGEGGTIHRTTIVQPSHFDYLLATRAIIPAGITHRGTPRVTPADGGRGVGSTGTDGPRRPAPHLAVMK